MAYDKIITIRRRLDNCLNYVLNEKKTHKLVTAINCRIETAFQEMQATKRRWDKQGGILGYHIIHSYAPGETTPEEAHAAGVEFARHLLGEQYEAIVSTHHDREHLHCHIVFNSVSFMDGRKYRSDFKSYYGDLRNASNAVSREHGLSVIEPEGYGRHYAEWNAERRGKTTLRSLVRQDIDAAIVESFTFGSFLSALRRQGYTIKYGTNVKHTAVCPPGGKRFFRLDSLGSGYTEADIRARLSAIRSDGHIHTMSKPGKITVPRYLTRRRKKLTGFRALYVYYLLLLKGRLPGKRAGFSDRREVTKLTRYARQFRLLQEYRIDDDCQLEFLGDALQAEIDALVIQRKDLHKQKRAGEDVSAELQQINVWLRALRRKLKICAEIEKDIPRIREQSKQTENLNTNRRLKQYERKR